MLIVLSLFLLSVSYLIFLSRRGNDVIRDEFIYKRLNELNNEENEILILVEELVSKINDIKIRSNQNDDMYIYYTTKNQLEKLEYELEHFKTRLSNIAEMRYRYYDCL